MDNSSFSTFLDEKFIPLSTKVKTGICVGLVLIPMILFYFIFFLQKGKEIDTLEQKIKVVETELESARLQKARLPQFEAEVAEVEQEFSTLSGLLPKEKEIPQLLKNISALGRVAGLDFNTFKPEAEIPEDFYKKIPIVIKVRGPYHNMGYFFDQVSKLERIVSVTNVKMSSPKKEPGEMLLESDCKLLTYQYSGTPLPTEEKK